MNDFEKDLEIDVMNLDVEAMRQPELYFKYSTLAKEAREKFDMMKMKLNVTESELAQKARLKPRAFGLTKVTEGAVSEAVKLHPRYQSVYKKMIQAKNEADLMYHAQEALNQKKRMIELLVKLHGSEYFSGPSVPHTPQELWKKVKQKRGRKTHEKMVTKTRKRKSRGKS